MAGPVVIRLSTTMRALNIDTQRLSKWRRHYGVGSVVFVWCVGSASPAFAQAGYTPPAEETEPSAELEGAEEGDVEEEASDVPPPPLPSTADDDDAEGEPEGMEQGPASGDGPAVETKGDGAPVAATGSAQVGVVSSDARPAFKWHGVFAGAKAISGYQSKEFGFGVSGLTALEWGPTPAWGIQGEAGFVYLGGTKKEAPEGLAELDGGAGAHVALGLRIRPMANSKSLPHPGGPWLSGAAGAAFTARKLAPLFDVFLGYDFLLSERSSVGPTLGYIHVIQTDKTGPRTDSASIGLLGIHGTFDFGVWEPKLEDRDGDGIFDKDDKCPDRPEDRDGFQDEDGCPDLDNDEDQIRDVDDKCPLDPEDMDEFEDEDGCPEPDNDKDGILDADDQCKLDPEDMDDFEDEDGCPELDNDRDGIVDIKDLCPNEPETRNGIADNDGCPDEESVRVVGDKIELDQKIHFWTNSDRIRSMSYPVLDKLANFLIQHPEYAKVDIEGHADARGDEKVNLELSKRRAHSILEYLAGRGIARERLASEGYGSTRPLVEGKTEHAWFMNRRVEFIVTRNREVKMNPETGEPLKPEATPTPKPAFGTEKEPQE